MEKNTTGVSFGEKVILKCLSSDHIISLAVGIVSIMLHSMAGLYMHTKTSAYDKHFEDIKKLHHETQKAINKTLEESDQSRHDKQYSVPK